MRKKYSNILRKMARVGILSIAVIAIIAISAHKGAYENRKHKINGIKLTTKREEFEA